MESAQHDKDLSTLFMLTHVNENKEKLRQIFKEIVREETEHVTIWLLQRHFQDPVVRAYFASIGIELADAWTLIKLLDAEQKGYVTIDEFVEGCMGLKGEAKAFHIAELKHEQRQMQDSLEAFIADVEKNFDNLMLSQNM